VSGGRLGLRTNRLHKSKVTSTVRLARWSGHPGHGYVRRPWRHVTVARASLV